MTPPGAAPARPGWRSLLGLVTLIVAISFATQWWRGHAQGEVGARLAQRAQPGDIRLLSSTTCPYCTLARQFLQRHQVAFDECFIERDARCRADYEATLARGTPTLIVNAREGGSTAPGPVVLIGFDATRVLHLLGG